MSNFGTRISKTLRRFFNEKDMRRSGCAAFLA